MTDTIKRLRELHQAATAGPWTVDAYNDVTANGEDVARIASIDHAEADAALIAAMHEALPGLLDEVERLRGERAEWMADASIAADDKHQRAAITQLWKEAVARAESAEARLAELEGRVRDAPGGALTVEPPHRFIVRDADPTILRLDGQRVKLLRVGDAD